MNKLISRYKLLFGCLAVMVLMPVSKLMADYVWIGTPSIYDSSTSDYYYEGNHLTCEVDTSLYPLSANWYANSSGFYMPFYLKAFSDVWMWSMGEEYSNEIDITAESEVKFQVDWDWNGPPATAPGADVDLNIILDSTQDSNSAYFDPNDAATSYAEGCCISWGLNAAWDSADSYTAGCAGYIHEYVDEGYSYIEDSFYLGTPDSENWYEYEVLNR